MSAPFVLASIGAGLPFADVVDDLMRALMDGPGAVVVEAPPGTGKTTLVPPAVAVHLAERGAGSQRVVLTQPRRVAARAAARRLATLTGTEVGDLVGVTVRGQRDVGPATRIEVVTPGVLLRRLLRDPDLPGVGAVVLDEVHERGLETDLLIGLLAEVRQIRDDLVLVAMSATLDAARLADLLGADVVRATAATHPLDVRWAPLPGPFAGPRGLRPEFLDHVAAQTASAWRETRDVAGEGHDALVFLPAVADVRAVAARLRDAVPDADVLELHGQLRPAEQDRATSGRRPGDRRRIVVTTALAESSITVPGVRLVIDAGLSREPRRDATRGMNGLVTVRCSAEAATQRAGRAARQGPGVVVRCYDAETFAAMPPHITPEVKSADLTAAALVLAAWGSPGGKGLALPDTLPPAALADAVAELQALDALDTAGRITATGRDLVRIPADPRLARALTVGAARVGAHAAAEVIAALVDDLRPEGADLTRLLVDLRERRHPASRRWRQEVSRLVRLLEADPDRARTPASHDEVGLLVALAHPRRVARRSGEAYLLTSGTRATLPRGSGLAGSTWLAVADVSRTAAASDGVIGAIVRAAAPLQESDALDAAGHLLHEQELCTLDGGRVTARRVRALGGIELSATPVAPSAQSLTDLWRRELARDLGVLPWAGPAEALRRRLAFCHHHLGQPWPDVRDAALIARLEEWFDLTARSLERVDLTAGLRALLPWPAAARLDELAPARLVVADGTSAAVEYPPVPEGPGTDEPYPPPVVAVRLQSCFGLRETPRLADGAAPVLFHLLSPARRPLAITDDLASFWDGPYAQVRAEMRGRYPKHPWPERPSPA
ncbi:MAG: ATP-dependent helicase HrpB [Mobilicoccus sp.]|nr:ATP-dependent helicase HrpB [Mobilicoccus sp.]